MAVQSGISLYDQIKQSLTGQGVKKDFGFFDFSTVSYGPAPEGTFETPSYPALEGPAAPPGMVREQVPGLIGEIDYSKGRSPGGFYRDVEMDVGMYAATAPGGMAQTTQTRTEVLTDAEAFAQLGIAPGQYDVLDQVMSNIGYTGAYDFSRSQQPAGSIGFTRTTEAGRQAQSFVSAIAGPFGLVADAIFGDQYVGLGGLQEFESFGMPGLVTEQQYRGFYDIAKQEQRERPGYNVYVSPEGQLRGYKPAEGITKLFGQEYTALGATDINQVRTELAVNNGFDPATFDLGTMRGDPLGGFVVGFGGFTADGGFVNMQGEKSASGMNHGYRGMQYASALADVYGQDYAANTMRNQASMIAEQGGFFSNARSNYYNSIADQVASGVREQYTYGTGKAISTGGYVRSSTGQPVRTATGFAYSGRMYSPAERSENLASFAESRGFDMDRGSQDYSSSYDSSLGFDEGDL